MTRQTTQKRVIILHNRLLLFIVKQKNLMYDIYPKKLLLS